MSLGARMALQWQVGDACKTATNISIHCRNHCSLEHKGLLLSTVVNLLGMGCVQQQSCPVRCSQGGGYLDMSSQPLDVLATSSASV
jgi:hypothetical protein